MTNACKRSVGYINVFRDHDEEEKHMDKQLNKFGIYSRSMMWSMALLLTAFVAGCGSGGGGGAPAAGGAGGGAGNPGPAGASPSLGRSASYGIFAASGAAVTLDPSVTPAGSLVQANVGLDPGPANACNGCNPQTVTGSIDNGNPAEANALTDFNAAYTDAANRSANACAVSGDLSNAGACGGPTYAPGLYNSQTSLNVGSAITLDAGGNPDAVFIFQMGSTLDTGTASVVSLAGGAQAKNVWWMVGTAATLGVSSTFKGTVIASGPTAAAVTVKNGTLMAPTDVEGRLFSSGAAATVGGFATIHLPQ